jgi:AraC-like DNA-binding protein
MDQKPWHQRKKLDRAFPFRSWDTDMRGFTYHWHEYLEVIYVLSGRSLVTVDGQSYEAFPGDIVIINSSSIHGFINDQDTKLVLFQFGLEFFDRSLIDLRDRIFQKLVFSSKTFISSSINDTENSIHNHIERLLLDLREEYSKQKDGYRLAIKSKLYEMALMFVREIPLRQLLPKEVVRRKYNYQILERIFTFIHNNASNSAVTLEQAANVAALSKFYFTRFFKKQTGETFHSYLSKVRINRAEEFLTGTDLPITDIAFNCGFQSLITFNRLFKMYTGTCPSTYRNQKTKSSKIALEIQKELDKEQYLM